VQRVDAALEEPEGLGLDRGDVGLEADWRRDDGAAASGDGVNDDELLTAVIGEERLPTIDRFDRVQLAEVVRTCRRHRSLSAAGRDLFSASRAKRATANDADRPRKYLLRFGLDYATVATNGAYAS
jgi:transcriptional regulatory protein RtcR